MTEREIISDEEAAIHPAWYCVRTPTKREHIAAARLRELEGVEVLCPRLRYRKATRRGKIWWVEALFPGYLLARFDLTHMGRAVRYAQGVRGLVSFRDQVPEVPEEFVRELEREIRERCEDGPAETVTVHPSVEPGEEVEVAHGPFQGFRGPVTRVLSGAERVRVLLEFLGGEREVDFDLFSILLPGRPEV
jgi:transcriptional antiterminator RfaH